MAESESERKVRELFEQEADRITLVVNDVLTYQKKQKLLRDKTEFDTETVESMDSNIRKVIHLAAVDFFNKDESLGVDGDGQFVAIVQKLTNGGIKIDVYESIAGIVLFPKTTAATAS